MNTIPPDWDDDRKLWETLGRLAPEAPPSNFAHEVHQKLAQKGRGKSRFFTFDSLVQVFRGWSWMGVSLAFCLLMGIAISAGYLLHEVVSQNKNSPKGSMAAAQNVVLQILSSTNFPESADTASGGETPQMAENYELLQDFDVIEHLDEMM